MLRVVTSFFLLLASQSFALDLSKMSDKERALFQKEIRLYLLENPEIIMEAVEVLRQKEQQAAIQSDFELVKNYKRAIFDDGYSFIGGNLDGDITLVEFVDYKCGYCKKAHGEVEKTTQHRWKHSIHNQRISYSWRRLFKNVEICVGCKDRPW